MVITTTLRSAFAIGFSLAVLMAATCSHHFATALHVPDASWAVFFVAGFYLRPLWTFPALLALAGVSDYVAITSFGVSDFCMSPAYGFLLPAYGSLWFAGRWYAARHRFTFSHAGPVGGQSVPGRGGMRVDLERRLLFLLGAVCKPASSSSACGSRSISRPLWRAWPSGWGSPS
jgi:hypothetical protein